MKQMRLNFSGKQYPEAPGWKAQETSYSAAKAIESEAAGLRNLCFSVLCGGDRTADEVADYLGKSVLAIRPRLSELLKQGRITDTGKRRPNESGKFAIVWGLTAAEHERMKRRG